MEIPVDQHFVRHSADQTSSPTMFTMFKVTSMLFLPHSDVRFEPQRVGVAALNALRRCLVIGRLDDIVSYKMLGERRLSKKKPCQLKVLIACCCGDDGG